MKRFILIGLLASCAAVTVLAQAAPVVASDDPESLFTDPDPVLNRNKQAAMHIVRDLLEAGRWNEADQWITERYIQHNPQYGSGRAPIVAAFGKGTPRAVPGPKEWRTKVVSVIAEDDLVVVAFRREMADPRPGREGQMYTTTWFDMWRFVDGKADEHWDYGTIPAPNPNANLKGNAKAKGK